LRLWYSIPVAETGFQIFAKPAGAACNLACRYCYYLDKSRFFANGEPARMSESILETYIARHIAASPDEIIRFSWHGGEPTLLGLDFFRAAVSLQRKHARPGRRIANGMQTNGTLLDADWGRFLAEERFAVGISLDGPPEVHDLLRVNKGGRPSFKRAMRGYEILRRYRVATDVLCVVGAHNAGRPGEVYGFFKSIDASYVSFLPLVERRPGSATGNGVSPETVPAGAWGDFLCAVFDEWVAGDIGRIKVQIFEEAARTAFGQEHSLCIFRPVCGGVPILEHNGDLYSCDHFVDDAHLLGNVAATPLDGMIDGPAQRDFGRAKLSALPRVCRECEVREMCNGECPKNRFLRTPDGEPGGNYLCPGYRKFFNRCRPFVDEVAAEWRRRNALNS
jgi:uncharacterized protein